MKTEKSTIHYFLKNCKIFPDRTAVFVDDREYTYNELLIIVSNIRSELIMTQNNKKLIGILTERNIYTYASLLAIFSLGIAFVPLNGEDPVERLAEIVSDSEIDTILVSKSNKKNVEIEASNKKVKSIETSLINDAKIIDVIPAIEENSLAYMIFTSGSTGKPKGVPIYNKNLNSFLSFMTDKKNYQLNEDDRFLEMFELTFDAFLISIVTALSIGASFYVVPLEGVYYFNIYNLMEEKKITFANVVPSLVTYLKPYFSELDLPHLKYFLSGGEALSDELMSEWSKCMPNGAIENVYGPTESTIFCTSYKWHPSETKKEIYNGLMPIGKSLDNSFVLIIDEENNVLPDGEKGEMLLCGELVTNHYWKDDKKTMESFIQIEYDDKLINGYKSGDIGFVNENKNLVFVGRVDEQVKIDGYRVELGEVESRVKNISNLQKIAVITKTNEMDNLSIHLFIEDYKNDISTLSENLAKKMPSYMLPSEIHNIDKIPITANGKNDKKKLKKLLEKI
ncbi:MAG: AMP-binding protein [Bacteroidetes bacterium]|nr:AMP-binding protein [Bacteroidota bacterium]MBT7491624.1 AMP-binding protein [Bacteroidota bacterium]